MPQVEKLIDALDLDGLKELCEKTVEKEIGEYSIHKLRELARKMCIPYYTKYSKSELLSVITKWRRERDVQAA